jgi:alkylhydroperoxidase/carboxymuconolactone decarboxylase family protein YurZ
VTESPSKAAAPGFDTNLDYSLVDEISADEAAALAGWYEREHGDGQGDLTPFVSFLVRHRPGALKLYRAYAQALDEDGRLPQVAVALLFLHYYMARGNERGVLYEVVAARQWGATKREVLDTIEMSFLQSGPLGGNAAAAADTYLSQWPDAEERRIPDPWPAGWSSSRAGGATLPPESALGRLLREHQPTVAAALAARLAHARSAAELPPVMGMLCELFGAVTADRPDDAAAAARDAVAAGVSAAGIVEVVGFAGLYATTRQLERVAAALIPILPSARAVGR